MSEVVGTRANNGVKRLNPVGGSTKRLIDILLAVIGVLALLPLFSLCYLGVLLASRGPVIFRHRRVGFQGRAFDCLKFRTISVDADERLADYLRANPQAEREWAETRKLRYDPRVTPFGAVLRKTGLDELPQLFNVLMGDMSMVGPRPVTDREIEKYGPHASAYLACKPGITGLGRPAAEAKPLTANVSSLTRPMRKTGRSCWMP